MKYYKLRWSSDIEEVGVYPQCQYIKDVGDVQKSFMHLPTFINFDFNLPKIELDRKAKCNSLIRVEAIPSWFLIINNSLLSFLQKYQIGKFQKWELQTYRGNETIEMYNMFLLNETKQEKYINFQKSEFYIGTYKDFTFKGDKVVLSNYKEYLKERDKLKKSKKWLRYDKVVFDLSNNELDLFRLENSPLTGYFVSENLKNAIEENGFTGMRFEEVSKLKKVEVIY